MNFTQFIRKKFIGDLGVGRNPINNTFERNIQSIQEISVSNSLHQNSITSEINRKFENDSRNNLSLISENNKEQNSISNQDVTNSILQNRNTFFKKSLENGLVSVRDFFYCLFSIREFSSNENTNIIESRSSIKFKQLSQSSNSISQINQTIKNRKGTSSNQYIHRNQSCIKDNNSLNEQATSLYNILDEKIDSIKYVQISENASIQESSIINDNKSKLLKLKKKRKYHSKNFKFFNEDQVDFLMDLILNHDDPLALSEKHIIYNIFPYQWTLTYITASNYLDDIKLIFEECILEGSKSSDWNVIHYSNGTYQGFYSDITGMKHFGIYSWRDGHQYIGRFQNGKQDSLGFYTWPTKGRYFGFWKGDSMFGLGIYMSKEGKTYYGTWISDLQDGIGIKILPSNVCFGKNYITSVEKYFIEECIKGETLNSKEIRIHAGKNLYRNLLNYAFTDVYVNISDY